MNEEIFDVILQTTGHFRADLHIFQENRPPEHFVFNEEFWIGSLPHDVDSDRIFDACQPAGLNFRPARQYGMRYAFCRRMRPESSDYYQWGSDLALPITVFLSRLIRPTTIALDYSARLYFENGELKTIVPGHTQGLGAHAWVVAKDMPDAGVLEALAEPDAEVDGLCASSPFPAPGPVLVHSEPKKKTLWPTGLVAGDQLKLFG